MASLTEQIRLVFEAATGRATAEVAKLDTALDKAGKTTTGLQGQTNRAAQLLKTTWPLAAASAATAVAGFAASAVAALEQAGLAAKRFGDATVISTEAASRWIEVGSDTGVAADVIQVAFGRLEKAAGSNAKAFADAGIEIAKTSDGTLDANETLIRTIEALNGIADARQRATAGSAIFGRGWQEIVRLGPQVRAQLKGVSDGIAITDAEARKAQAMHDFADQLSDAFAGAKNEVGEFALDAVKAITQLGFTIQQFALNAVDLVNSVPLLGRAIDDSSLRKWQESIDRGRDNLEHLGEAATATGNELDDMTDKVVEGRKAIDSLASSALDVRAAQRSLADAIAARDAGQKKLAEQLPELTDAEQAYKAALDDLRGAQEDASQVQAGQVRQLGELAKASNDVADAQQRIVDAREKLTRAQSDGARDIERAEIALADAKRDRDKAGNSNDADGFKDALDKVRLAELNLDEARERAGQNVTDAQRDIVDAEQDVADKAQESKQKRIDLEREIAEAATDGADKIADARKKVDDTERKLGEVRAERATLDAQRWRDQAALVDAVTAATLKLNDAQKAYNDNVKLIPPFIKPAPLVQLWSDANLAAANAERIKAFDVRPSAPTVAQSTAATPYRGSVTQAVAPTTVVNMPITQNISDADPRRLAAGINRELGRALASGDFAGRLRGPQ